MQGIYQAKTMKLYLFKKHNADLICIMTMLYTNI